MAQKSKNIYLDSGVEFDSILLDGALGGIPALNRYLHIRSKQMARICSDPDMTDQDRIRFVAMLKALEEARFILPKLFTIPEGKTNAPIHTSLI